MFVPVWMLVAAGVVAYLFARHVEHQHSLALMNARFAAEDEEDDEDVWEEQDGEWTATCPPQARVASLRGTPGRAGSTHSP
jgi:hypothetical protein